MINFKANKGGKTAIIIGLEDQDIEDLGKDGILQLTLPFCTVNLMAVGSNREKFVAELSKRFKVEDLDDGNKDSSEKGDVEGT